MLLWLLAPGEELDIAVLEKTSTIEGMHKFLQEADETRLAACRKSTQQHVSIRQGILDGTYDGAFRQVLKNNTKPQMFSGWVSLVLCTQQRRLNETRREETF